MAGVTKKPRARPRAAPQAAAWLTRARKRELLGSALVALAVATAAGFFAEPGVVTAAWVGVLRALVGWGAVAVPLFLGALGVWFVLDAVDAEAGLRWQRPAAAIAGFVALIGLIHLVVDARADSPGARVLAGAGNGGGWLGYAVSTPLDTLIGEFAAGAALATVGVLGIAFATGLTVRVLVAETIHLALRALGGARDIGARAVRGLSRNDAVFDEDWDAPPVPLVAPETAPVAALKEEPAAPDEPDLAAPAGPAKWRLPGLTDVLEPAVEAIAGPDDAEAKARLIQDTLAEFGVPVRIVEIQRGPTVTQFGLEPGVIVRGGQRSRVKVSKIVSLQNDLALALAASPIRVLAPVPGRPYVGIEVPNSASAVVTLRGVMETDVFRRLVARGGLPVALGRDTTGNAIAADLATMPHLLIAGATGSGKSVALNGIVSTLLLTHTPETLKLLLVDPKRVELAPFRGLPHLAAPVIVDAEKVVGVLQWVVREMDRRYRLFAERGARHLAAFNAAAARNGDDPLPFLVLVIDELADLMMVAPDEVERLVTRLAQLARATGIHLIIATQRPSVDVVTGLIKANFPSRIAFAVASSIDSRVILDSVGADKLLGRGDMLYMASDSSKLVRLQGCYVSDREIQRITAYWQRAVPQSAETDEAVERIGVPAPLIQADIWDSIMDPVPVDEAHDPLWDDALLVLREHRAASTSFLQRKLRIGYSRAARLMDAFEAAGYVGAAQGNQARDVLVEWDEAGEMVAAALQGEEPDAV